MLFDEQLPLKRNPLKEEMNNKKLKKFKQPHHSLLVCELSFSFLGLTLDFFFVSFFGKRLCYSVGRFRYDNCSMFCSLFFFFFSQTMSESNSLI